jgi:hypothetical protein
MNVLSVSHIPPFSSSVSCHNKTLTLREDSVNTFGLLRSSSIISLCLIFVLLFHKATYPKYKLVKLKTLIAVKFQVVAFGGKTVGDENFKRFTFQLGRYLSLKINKANHIAIKLYF